MHQVYAYGVVAPSTLYELGDPFPPTEGYAEITGAYPSIGGEAAAGAYVLARLGIAVKLAGNRLGTDEPSRRALETLQTAGVDTSSIWMDPELKPVIEVVFATGGGRTVFGTYGRLLAEGSWDDPSEDDIRESRAVCLDPFFGEASLRAARWCAGASVPYVTVDTPPDSEIASGAAVLVISEEFAGRTMGTEDPAGILGAYTQNCGGLVILTRGGERLLYGRRGQEPQWFDPVRVDVRDTTGAGDAFRAGIVYGVLEGLADRPLIRVASAIAAIVCTGAPGVLEAPTERELRAFMAESA